MKKQTTQNIINATDYNFLQDISQISDNKNFQNISKTEFQEYTWKELSIEFPDLIIKIKALVGRDEFDVIAYQKRNQILSSVNGLQQSLVNLKNSPNQTNYLNQVLSNAINLKMFVGEAEVLLGQESINVTLDGLKQDREKVEAELKIARKAAKDILNTAESVSAEELKKGYRLAKADAKKNLLVFYGVFILSLLGAVIFVSGIVGGSYQSTEKSLIDILYRVGLVTPLIYIAWLMQKRIMQKSMIYEEYHHKEKAYTDILTIA